MSAHLAQIGAPQSETLYPRLRLKAYDHLWIENGEYVAQKRQGNKWVLVDCETQELRIETDYNLLRLSGEGKLNARSRPQARAPLSPLSPEVSDSARRVELTRMHRYVQHPLKHEEGFRASKPWLAKRIAEVAKELGDQNPPSPGSVLNWKKLHDTAYAEIGLAAYAPRHDLKGKRGSRLPEPMQTAMEQGTDRYLQGGSIEDAYVEVLKSISEYNRSAEGKRYCKQAANRHLDDKGELRAPSLSTFRRKIGRLSPFVTNSGRIGQYYARKNSRTFQTRALPDRPYEEVEVDFTPVDLILVAENGAYLGRPHLIAFLDRATRMVLGMSISFDGPSYAAVIEGLRHTIYRKEISHVAGLTDSDWPCMGRIERLYIDNGKEFANGNLLSAAQDIGFEIHRLPPREPWHKGLVERFMGEVARFSHRFPGTTHSNAVAHRDYEDLDVPVLTLGEFRDLAIKWIVTDFNRRPNRMLGNAPGVARAPIDAWRDKLNLLDVPGLPDPELFIALAGEREERTVQKYGVEWDHIRYWAPDLDRIFAHPSHRLKSSSGNSAKYRVHRDPYDLSRIYLHNHHANEVITLPVVEKWRKYAKSLTLHQHKLCRDHELIREEQRGDPDALWKARSALIDAGMGALQSGRRKNLERKLARFLYGKGTQPFPSEVAEYGAVARSEGLMPLGSAIDAPVHLDAEIIDAADPALATDPRKEIATIAPSQGTDDLAEIVHLAAGVKSGIRRDG